MHAYVGDEVVVSWPVSDKPARNARCIACFFAIEAKIARLAPDYEAEFGVAPAFRAGLHAGTVVVSECGDAKRQLAYFGDTMNVGARLCDYCKTINQRLVVSGDLLRLIGVIDDWAVGEGELIAVRGRARTGGGACRGKARRSPRIAPRAQVADRVLKRGEAASKPLQFDASGALRLPIVSAGPDRPRCSSRDEVALAAGPSRRRRFPCRLE